MNDDSSSFAATYSCESGVGCTWFRVLRVFFVFCGMARFSRISNINSLVDMKEVTMLYSVSLQASAIM